MSPADRPLDAQGGASETSDSITIADSSSLPRRDDAHKAPARAHPGHGQASVEEEKGRNGVLRCDDKTFLSFLELMRGLPGCYVVYSKSSNNKLVVKEESF